jgi:putative membrane protein
VTPQPSRVRRARRAPLDLVRGALIGLAEVVPGVSGGTIALVTGVYDTLIIGAGHVVTGVRRGVADLARGRGTDRARAELRQARWEVLVPVGAAMAVAVVVGAKVLEPVLEDEPVGSRAVFFGLICASLVVPLRLAARSARERTGHGLTARALLPGLAAAVVAFVVTGLPPGDVADPPLLLVTAVASVAVCALVLPGVSGSFFLLTVGLYETTLAAVNDRDLLYLAAFVLGAVVGLATFVKALQWLLEHRFEPTLVVMAGLMAGSLRALWPWQSEDRSLHGPGEDVGTVLLLGLTGAGLVLALLAVEHVLESRRESHDGTGPPPGAAAATAPTDPSG